MEPKKFSVLLAELKQFYAKEFRNQNFFTIIYGSQAYGDSTTFSDLDMCTFVEKPSREQIERTVKFTLDLHQRYGLGVDAEVRHEKKLVVPLETLAKAVKGLGFRFEKGRVEVAPVIKTSEYLNSQELIRRLNLNSITSKNIFVAGDKKLYYKYRERAIDTLICAIFSIQKFKPMNPREFVKALLYRGKLSGEAYLGYKDRPRIKAYLNQTIGSRLIQLAREEKLSVLNGRYAIKEPRWMRNFQENFFARQTRASARMPRKTINPAVPKKLLRK